MKRAWKLWVGLMALSISALGHELIFPWYPGLGGWLLINRTSDWRNSIQIERVKFEDQGRHFSNSAGVFTVIQFNDTNPPLGEAFYTGVILTNQ